MLYKSELWLLQIYSDLRNGSYVWNVCALHVFSCSISQRINTGKYAWTSDIHALYSKKENKQGVALTGRNRTGPPWSVGCPTDNASGGRPPAALQTTTDDADRQQTPTSKTILAH